MKIYKVFILFDTFFILMQIEKYVLNIKLTYQILIKRIKSIYFLKDKKLNWSKI